VNSESARRKRLMHAALFSKGLRHPIGLVVGLCAVSLTLALFGAPSALAAGSPRFGTAKLNGARDRTEPRATITPDGRRYVITNDGASGRAVVYVSDDGGLSFHPTIGQPPNGAKASTDVDLVSTRTGRLIASELDYQAISFVTSYSDDGGRTWKQSFGGSQTADTDRQWLAVGPNDPKTNKPRVYLLYHNLASGTAQHNMFVVTSTDGGETFGVPVPIAMPPSAAYQDLQCADSGGPSNLLVDQHTGSLFAIWGTRSAPFGGGCGASVFGPFEANVVGATRIWVAGSPDNSPGSWRTHLAVDDAKTGQLVSMQLSPGALDSAGNIYVAYAESRHPYPNYDSAAIKYVHAGPDLSRFSKPQTVRPPTGAGHVLPHIVAGDPGKLDFAYFTGINRGDPRLARPAWYTEVAQTTDGLSANPRFTFTRPAATVPTYTGTASELMGACGKGPAAGVENGLTCTRSTDVWGIALDRDCNLTITWPTRDNASFAAGEPGTRGPDPAFNVAGNNPGTFVSTQSGGPRLCR
jgi:hypothetical protein